jgi:hypothetical protein
MASNDVTQRGSLAFVVLSSALRTAFYNIELIFRNANPLISAPHKRDLLHVYKQKDHSRDIPCESPHRTVQHVIPVQDESSVLSHCPSAAPLLLKA